MYDEQFAPRSVTSMAETLGPRGVTAIPPSLDRNARVSRNAIWLLLGVVVYCSAQVCILI
jgi:hypothetical protein